MLPFSTAEPLRIRKGETFERILRWETNTIAYAAMSAATQAGPVAISANAHGIPDGWRIARIVGVLGMKQLNTHRLVAGEWVETPLGENFSEGIVATVSSANALNLNAVNSASYDAYTSGGILEYYTPKDLTGYTARMQVRASADDDTVLLELTTDPDPDGNPGNSRIVIDNTEKTITLSIEVDDIDAIDWETGVATLEMVSSTGVVTLLIPNQPVVVGDTDVTRT